MPFELTPPPIPDYELPPSVDPQMMQQARFQNNAERVSFDHQQQPSSIANYYAQLQDPGASAGWEDNGFLGLANQANNTLLGWAKKPIDYLGYALGAGQRTIGTLLGTTLQGRPDVGRSLQAFYDPSVAESPTEGRQRLVGDFGNAGGFGVGKDGNWSTADAVGDTADFVMDTAYGAVTDPLTYFLGGLNRSGNVARDAAQNLTRRMGSVERAVQGQRALDGALTPAARMGLADTTAAERMAAAAPAERAAAIQEFNAATGQNLPNDFVPPVGWNGLEKTLAGRVAAGQEGVTFHAPIPGMNLIPESMRPSWLNPKGVELPLGTGPVAQVANMVVSPLETVFRRPVEAVQSFVETNPTLKSFSENTGLGRSIKSALEYPSKAIRNPFIRGAGYEQARAMENIANEEARRMEARLQPIEESLQKAQVTPEQRAMVGQFSELIDGTSGKLKYEPTDAHRAWAEEQRKSNPQYVAPHENFDRLQEQFALATPEQRGAMYEASRNLRSAYDEMAARLKAAGYDVELGGKYGAEIDRMESSIKAVEDHLAQQPPPPPTAGGPAAPTPTPTPPPTPVPTTTPPPVAPEAPAATNLAAVGRKNRSLYAETFQLDPKQRKALFAVTDTIAKEWGQRNGRDWRELYAGLESERVAGAAPMSMSPVEVQQRAYGIDGPMVTRGNIALLDGGRAMVRAFEGSTFETAVHEFAHYIRHTLDDVDKAAIGEAMQAQGMNGRFITDVAAEIQQQAAAKGWTPEQLQSIKGKEPTAPLDPEMQAARKSLIEARNNEEWYAHAFTRYLKDGSAPTKGLLAVFEKVKAYLLKVYESLKNEAVDSIDMSLDVREHFDRLLGGRTLEDADVPTASGIGSAALDTDAVNAAIARDAAAREARRAAKAGTAAPAEAVKPTGPPPQSAIDERTREMILRDRAKQGLVEDAPPGTALAAQPDGLANTPIAPWLKEAIDRDFATAQKLGIVEAVERMSADGKTVRQIAQEFKTNSIMQAGDKLDREAIIRSVKAKRGIPSMDEKTEFAAWKKKIQSPDLPAKPPEQITEAPFPTSRMDRVPQSNAVSNPVSMRSFDSMENYDGLPVTKLRGVPQRDAAEGITTRTFDEMIPPDVLEKAKRSMGGDPDGWFMRQREEAHAVGDTARLRELDTMEATLLAQREAEAAKQAGLSPEDMAFNKKEADRKAGSRQRKAEKYRGSAEEIAALEAEKAQLLTGEMTDAMNAKFGKWKSNRSEEIKALKDERKQLSRKAFLTAEDEARAAEIANLLETGGGARRADYITEQLLKVEQKLKEATEGKTVKPRQVGVSTSLDTEIGEGTTLGSLQEVGGKESLSGDVNVVHGRVEQENIPNVDPALAEFMRNNPLEHATPKPGGKKPVDYENYDKNFWNWFGKSKAVDEGGRPIRLFHGTKGDFDRFTLANGSNPREPAFFLSANKNPRGGEGFDAVEGSTSDVYSTGKGGNTMPVYVRAERPLEVEMNGRGYDPDKVASSIKKAKLEGHDSVIFRSMDDGNGPDDIYAVFSANQIKSQTGNRGGFSRASDNVLESAAPLPKEEREANLKRWAKDSVLKESDGSPWVLYHGKGGAGDFDQFSKELYGTGAGGNLVGPGTYLTKDSTLGSSYAGKDGSVFKVHARAKKPFDFDKPITNDEAGLVIEAMKKDPELKAISGNKKDLTEKFEIEASRLQASNNALAKAKKLGDSYDLSKKMLDEAEKNITAHDGSSRFWPKALYQNAADEARESLARLGKELNDIEPGVDPSKVAALIQTKHYQIVRDYRSAMNALDSAIDFDAISGSVKGKTKEQFYAELQQALEEKHDDPGWVIRRALEANGYDGILHTGGKHFGRGKLHQVFVAFDPETQLKSAIGNKGIYNERGTLLESAKPAAPFKEKPLAEVKKMDPAEAAAYLQGLKAHVEEMKAKMVMAPAYVPFTKNAEMADEFISGRPGRSGKGTQNVTGRRSVQESGPLKDLPKSGYQVEREIMAGGQGTKATAGEKPTGTVPLADWLKNSVTKDGLKVMSEEAKRTAVFSEMDPIQQAKQYIDGSFRKALSNSGLKQSALGVFGHIPEGAWQDVLGGVQRGEDFADIKAAFKTATGRELESVLSAESRDLIKQGKLKEVFKPNATPTGWKFMGDFMGDGKNIYMPKMAGEWVDRVTDTKSLGPTLKMLAAPFEFYMRHWKPWQTQYNLKYHIRNQIGDLTTMAQHGGLDFSSVKDFGKLYSKLGDLTRDGWSDFSAFKDVTFNLPESWRKTFGGAERISGDQLLSKIATEGHLGGGQIAMDLRDAGVLTGGKNVVAKIKNLATVREDINKVVAMLARGRAGDGFLEASLRAEEMCYNFSRVGPAVDFLRKTGVSPFLGWAAKNVPAQVEWAMRNPGQFGAVLRGMQLVHKGELPEDMLPEWLKNKFNIRVKDTMVEAPGPNGTTVKRPQYTVVTASGLIPIVDLHDLVNNPMAYSKDLLGPLAKIMLDHGDAKDWDEKKDAWDKADWYAKALAGKPYEMAKAVVQTGTVDPRTGIQQTGSGTLLKLANSWANPLTAQTQDAMTALSKSEHTRVKELREAQFGWDAASAKLAQFGQAFNKDAPELSRLQREVEKAKALYFAKKQESDSLALRNRREQRRLEAMRLVK